MPALQTFAVTTAVFMWSVLTVSTALSCDDDRYPCNFVAPRPFSGLFGDSEPTRDVQPFARTRDRAASPRRSTARKSGVTSETKAVHQPEIINDPPSPSTDGVRVFANDEMTDLDAQALILEISARQEMIMVEPTITDVVRARTEPADRVLSVAATFPRAYELDDQALLSRIVLTFGTALAAASAIRIFVR